MPPPENHHVKSERANIRDRYAEGVSAGVELSCNALPAWIAQVYAERGPYERGLLLGVLLEEFGGMDDG